MSSSRSASESLHLLVSACVCCHSDKHVELHAIGRPGVAATALQGCSGTLHPARSDSDGSWDESGAEHEHKSGDSLNLAHTLGELNVSNAGKWVWLKIKQEGQTAGFGPCFHLPGFHFGTGFVSHSQM